MSLYHLVEDYLKEQPLFRERRNKDRGIANLLINRYGLHHAIQSGLLTKDRIIAIVQDYASMDRMWRKLLERYPEFRGKDYDDKDNLEVSKMVELGYRVGKTPQEVEAVEKQIQSKLP